MVPSTNEDVMVNSGFEGVYIVGAAQTAYEKRSSKSVHRLFWEAFDGALSSAGLTAKQVDGMTAISMALPPDNVTTLAEHLGLECRWLAQGMFGGASGNISMLHGARAIQAGDASVVACLGADTFTMEAHLGTERNSGQRDYMAPWGYGSANGVFGLLTRLYMETHGITREDFGRLAVDQRANAVLNPNAIFREPLTLDQYMAGRVIADPIHLYDCVYPCTGGDAVILASEEIAKTLPGPHVRILGGGEMHNCPSNDIYAAHEGWFRFRDRMYAQAGCGPDDMDFVQVYDDYPVMSFIQLEALGFCEPGGAARLIRERGCSVRGTLPVNTGGGQLSGGQAGWSGGLIGPVEAVLQLRGEVGERQVSCSRGLVSGYGMVAYGRGLSTSAIVLAEA